MVLAMIVAMSALKLLLPTVAAIVGVILAIVGAVAIFRPLPQIGLRSRALAVFLALFVAPMGILDPKTNVDDHVAVGSAEPEQSAEERQAEEARRRREKANQEREERQAAGAAKLARLCGGDNAIAADVWSRTFVKRELKSPSSASFPWSGKAQALGDCEYRVVSYVEADNSFGAKLRYDPVTDKWALISLRFEE